MKTTQDIITARIIGAYRTILMSGHSKEEDKFAIKKLIEIAESCPNKELANEAKHLVSAYYRFAN